ISGKGGTGKTSITASFSVLGGKGLIVADCDVDAADMHLLLEPDFGSDEDFYSGELAEIDQQGCTQCGKCAEVCRFDAIPVIDGKYVVDPLSCEGCGYCARVCPEKVIANHVNRVGNLYVSRIKTGTKMVHAKLGIGNENSGKLVAQVKNKAKALAEKESKNGILVDGSPGVGCPVVSSLSGATFVVLVTEPTVSGLHDLKRVHELVKKFKIKSGCIINKADINSDQGTKIKKFLEKEDITLITEIPYDENFTKAMTLGKTIVEHDDKLGGLITDAWGKIVKLA
ncbi:MAG: (4Fe-4S)-binding protein, partial [Spirochaetes bacterium]